MKQKLSLVFYFLLTLLSADARNYIVCIGIADYPGSSSDLQVSGQDAATIKNVYEKNGEAITNILMNREATVENVKIAMNNLFCRATKDDAVVLFFSGHGVPGGFVCYDGLLKYETITNVMMGCSASKKMVFADACYAGKARNSTKRAQQTSQVEVMFFLSSRTEEKSLEKRGWRNSLFTAYLERGLRGGADTNHDRTITALELFDFVSKGVAKDSGQTQHPVMWGNFDNNMSIISWNHSTKTN